MSKPHLLVVNYRHELPKNISDAILSQLTILCVQESKGPIFAQKLTKHLTQHPKTYKSIICRGTAGSWREEDLGKVYKISRTFLRNNTLIDNQKYKYSEQLRDNIENQHINTIFQLGNNPPLMQEFAHLVDMEAFWIATVSTQFYTPFLIFKGITDIVTETKNNIHAFRDDMFQYYLNQANIQFLTILDQLRTHDVNTHLHYPPLPSHSNTQARTIPLSCEKKEQKGNQKENKEKTRELLFENPIQPYFNLTKQQIRAITGIKKGTFVREVPDLYGPRKSIGYGLTRGFNCIARCHYCYLQTYFKSPDLVQFVNTDALIQNIKETIKHNHTITQKKTKSVVKTITSSKTIIFYDGDFYDSFGFADQKKNIEQISAMIETIAPYDNIYLELRTKLVTGIPSDLLLLLNDSQTQKHAIRAITFSPREIITKYEPGTGTYDERFEFAQHVQTHGGKIGIRIDPFIFDQPTLSQSFTIYQNMITDLYERLDPTLIANIGIGTLRIKKPLYTQLRRHHHTLCNNLIADGAFYRYPRNTRKQIYEFLHTQLEHFADCYICMDEKE